MKTPPANPEIATLRQALDAVDEALARLLVCRVGLSRQAQAWKARVGLAPRDHHREAAILARYEQHRVGASAVARAILRCCRED